MADDDAGTTPADEQPAVVHTGPAGRKAPVCPTCSLEMRFEGGRQIHDLWSEHYVCARCGRETFRSYGRGSV